MTFRASLLASDLAAAAHRAASVAQSKLIPILAHAMLRFEGGKLLVAGTDTDRSIGMYVNADGKGAATVDAASLASFAKRLNPKDLAHLDIAESGLMAVVQGSARAELPYLPADDLPLDLVVADGFEWTVSGVALSEALARVSGAMANDPTRHYINGVYIDLSGKVAKLVAMDGRWMAVEPIDGVAAPDFASKFRKSLIIPREAIPQISGALSGSEDVTLWLSDFAFGVRNGEIQFKTKLVEGSYPDWPRLMPGKASTVARVRRDAFQNAFARVFAFDHGTATLDFTAEALEITGEAYSTFARRNTAVASCDTCPIEKLKGPAIETGFNSRVLSDLVASLPDAEILEFNLTADRTLIRDPARDAQSARVIMPLRSAAARTREKEEAAA